MPERTVSAFEWAGWVSTVAVGLGGYLISTLGWRVQGNQAKELARKKDIHASIDRCHTALTVFEDAVFSYWSDPQSPVRLDQLLNYHRRCVMALRQLQRLSPFDMPDVTLGELRKQATLDAESALRPLPPNSLRLKKFSRAMSKIAEAEYLFKAW
jgi:hypothetical protein